MAPLLWTVIRTLTIEIWKRPADLSDVTSAGFSLGGHSALALAGARMSKNAYIEYCDAPIGMLDCGWMTRGGVDFNDIDSLRYEASFKDPRITASIAIDPALPQAMTQESLSAIAHPTLLLNLGDYPDMPAGIDATGLAETIPNAQYAAFSGSWRMSGIGECSMLERLIIGASGYFTGEVNICGEDAWYRTIIRDDMFDEILPFMKANRARALGAATS